MYQQKQNHKQKKGKKKKGALTDTSFPTIKNKNEKKKNRQWDIPRQREGGEKASTMEMASTEKVASAAEMSFDREEFGRERLSRQKGLQQRGAEGFDGGEGNF